jgi:hypothetical protein
VWRVRSLAATRFVLAGLLAVATLLFAVGVIAERWSLMSTRSRPSELKPARPAT